MKTLKYVSPKTQAAWAVCDEHGIIVWHCMTDGEEGVEIHRTRALAEGAKMTGETVYRVLIQRAGR